MATRSTISIKTGKKSFKTIYCHWDGYPSKNGKILIEHYTDEKKILELVNLGSISSLAPNVAPNENTVHVKRGWDDDHNIVETECLGVPHTFDTPHKDVVISYVRDRGESYVDNMPSYSSSKKDIRGEEYDYLFEDGVWKVRSGVNFVTLTKKMCERN